MKKKLSLLMVSCMIVSSLSHANVSAATLQNEVTNDKQAQSVLSRIAEDTTVTMLGNQKVTLLVELKEPSLLEYFNETQTYARSGGRNSYDNFNAFSNSHDGLEQKSIIEKQQDDVIEKIEKKINEGKDVNVIRQFSDVANMIVIDATMKDIEEIKKISGVKAVNISYTYARPKVEYTEEQKTGRDLINGYDLDYTGKKQVVAVLDTGADIKHNAFAVTLAEDSIRYKKSDITKLLEDKTFNSEENGEGKSLTVADVSSYKGNKIVYAYDYADKDANVVPSVESIIDSGNDHGNHVAGIIGALSDEMSGIAPDCQLAIMKVFPDSNSGAPDYVVLAALEDCLKLDVDVINMSLGAACGYTHDEHDVREKVFNDIKEAGINLVVSAGNSGQSSDDNFWDGHALTSNPDTSTVGSPSTNPAALSVASLENTIHYGPCIIASDGTEIFGADSAVQSEFKFDIFATETIAEYVEIPDFGEEEDYEDIEVDGKVALVSRGTISFEDKQKIAFEKGAKAIIIYNNTNDGLISMSIKDRKIPSVFITKADGEKLKNLTDKKFTTKPGFYENENKGKMSGFSSWGCTPDLKLKPEITGVGGFIYSTLPFNTYGNMQGTSMSAPQIAGAVAVMKQYIAENNDKFSVVEGANQKGVVLENLVNNILMSTADVVTVSGSALGVKEEVRVPYSPRVQGAGLANLAAAIKTNAYLYNENNTETGRPVINYGESVEGVFTQNFQIRNISDKPVKYALDATVLSDEADVLDFELTGQRKNVISGTPFQLTANSTIIINSATGAEFVSGDAIGLKESAVAGCAITIAANSTVDLSLSIKLSDEDKEYLDNNFENGDFVEGFLKFNAVDDTNVDLSIPFLGFYGSWEKAPILETNIYDFFDGKVEDFPSNFTLRYLFSNTNRLGGIVDLGNRNGYITLGTNLYSDKQDAYSKYISISPNGDGYFDSFTWMYCPLRNPKKTDYYITTEDGTVVYEKHETGDRKSVYDDSTGKFDEWYGFMDWNGMYSGRPIPNNTELKFIFKAQIENATCVNENNTVTLPVVIDTEKPMLKDFEVDLDNQVLRVTISDNQYLCGGSLQDIEAYNEEIEKYLAGLTDEIDSDAYLQETPIANPEKKTEYTLEFSLNPEHDHYELEFSDYALNMRVFEIDLNEYKDTPTDTPTATPTPSNPNPGSGDQPVVTPTTTPTPTPTVTPEPEDDQTVVTTVDVADAKNAVVEEEKLEEALNEKKDVLIEIKDGDKVAYAWEFAANDYSKDVKLHDIKLGVTTKTGEESAYKNGVEVQFEQEGVLPMEAKVKVNVGDSFKPNQKVYLYRKDEKTGKLLCVPFSTYTVAKDGTVTLNVVQGDDYVILGKPAKSKDKVTVVNQIQVEKNVACKKGETISVAAQLPATLVRVSSMKEVSKSADATFGAVVTYKVSDSKVATVDKNGNLVAKKAGKVTVTVKVKLSNGVTKTFQTKVTIK